MRDSKAPGSLHPLFAAVVVGLLMLGMYGGHEVTTAVGWLGSLVALATWGYFTISRRAD